MIETQPEVRVAFFGPARKGATGGVKGVMEAVVDAAGRIPGWKIETRDLGSRGSGGFLANMANRARCLISALVKPTCSVVAHVQASRRSILLDALTMLLLRLRFLRVVAHVHCPSNAIASATLNQRLGWFLLRFAADRLLVIAPGIDRQFRRRWGDDVIVLPNFVDAAAIRETVRSAKKQNLIVYFGRMRRTKGVFSLLDVAPALALRGWRVRFIGPFDEMDEEREFRAQLEQLDNVEWLGRLDGDKKHTALAEGRIYALPSSHPGEVFPVSMIEAGCAGCAIVSTPIGVIDEVLKQGQLGVLLSSGEAADLLEGLLELLKDDAKIQSYADAWEKEVSDLYSLDAVQALLVELYEGDLAGARAAATPRS